MIIISSMLLIVILICLDRNVVARDYVDFVMPEWTRVKVGTASAPLFEHR